MTARWTTPSDIAAKVHRRWDDGSLLRSYADGAEFAPIDVVVRGPRASEVGDDLRAVQDWVAGLDAGGRGGARYDLEWTTIGGRIIGHNRVPSGAVVSSFAQAWALLGVATEVRLFDEVLALSSDHPAVRSWVVANPLRGISAHAEMPRLVAAFAWLDDNRHSSRYLREICAPGVDTKFAERHRPALAAMLGVPSSAAGFASALGLRSKPELVRLRVAPSLGLPEPLSEIAVRVDEFDALALAPLRVLVIENEVTYLSVPVPEDGVVLWGKGFDVDRVGRLPWPSGVEIDYWGDIDTHGFAILDRLRAWLPQVRSVMMDRDTLMVHRDRWVTEERPAASALTRLTRAEQGLHVDLVEGRLGDRVRLEQERIDWPWVIERLAAGVTSVGHARGDNPDARRPAR
jgi:hypothetical protein